MAGDMARLHTHPRRKQTSVDRLDPSGRGQAPAHRQLVRRAARNLQMAIVCIRYHAVCLRAHLEREDRVEGEYQRAINRMGRSTLRLGETVEAQELGAR